MTGLSNNLAFSADHLNMVTEAVSISEEVVIDHFALSLSKWKNYRYEIATLKDLDPAQVEQSAFAGIARLARLYPPAEMRRDFLYRVCLQDHNILASLNRENALGLLRPLLIYILTHELTHIVRFYRFEQNFESDEKERAREEARVHQLSYEMLRRLSLQNLDKVLDFYARHREKIF